MHRIFVDVSDLTCENNVYTPTQNQDVPFYEKPKTLPIVINLFGGPCTGKSTCAAYLFSQLKVLGYNVELVTEFAKEKAWENNTKAVEDQLYILGEQSHKMTICQKDVDIIITDSPLLLSILYNHDERLTNNFNNTVLDVFHSYNNLNFYLERNKKYNAKGRFQSEKEAKSIDNDIVDILEKYSIPYFNILGEMSGYEKILNIVKEFVKQYDL